MDDLGIPNWLKELPLAPEFYPTDTEFADPIAYISKIEKEASAFGICKVIPPLPKPSKNFVFANLNKSLSKAPELVSEGNRKNDGECQAVFTTRHQELGHNLKKAKGSGPVKQPSAHKLVWQSGEIYTLDQFKSKAKAFARNQLATVKDVSPLGIETLFWKVASEKAIYIEYANDVPGSGFGELEEPFQYFHKQRRKRKFEKKCQPSPNCENRKLDSTSNSHREDTIVQSDLEQSLETGSHSSNLSNLATDENLRFSRQSNAGTSKEGTAGWKISNSPWNLQVISRSPGSLTRFMLDDIPGVTSPMVYIGMLFSWFAWHVEDHELHSLNFLHMGSPKTWYAVPGNYAFDFEEVVRSKCYEGNLDRLAALTLLGEKTNLLSPEAVVASGIPCCRLVQNPGEYVVTFPRAYHVGFSHGFNCGEAANFGTSQWLKVAKEAAIRRAAMNYLPMLSHQQLLYMLTMSFVSRVPRTLLPGARSSRLRDRQKEERELVVKKAFIDDMLKENDLLLALLEKDSTLCAVLWDPESLSSPNKDPELFPSPANMVVSSSLVEQKNIDSSNHEKKVSLVENEHNDISNASTVFIGRSSLFESKYGDRCNSHTGAMPHRGKLEDFYMEYDDLPCGLHVDSGTLTCVACGILGFPFMAIVQPSLRASEELFPADIQALQDTLPYALLYPNDTVSDSTSDLHNPFPDISQVSKDLPRHSSSKIGVIYQKWNTSNGFLRPRIFCLEHALEIEELLQSKGGANVLIICHSAYPKIKAHAFAVAEEICTPFHYSEVPLENATQEDLNLINISIDDEHKECNEDWTSRLGINLQYHVKLRKLSPLKHEQHVLALGGLFSGIISKSDISTLKWTSRRSRTPMKVTSSQSKPSGTTHIEKGSLPMETSERNKFNGNNKVVQYSRRNSNSKRIAEQQASSKSHGLFDKRQESEVGALKQVSLIGISKDILCCSENVNGSLISNCDLQHGRSSSELRGDLGKVSDPPNFTTSSLATQKRENDLELDNFHRSSYMELEVPTIDEAKESSEVSDQANSTCPAAVVIAKTDFTECTNSHDFEKPKICTTEETGGASEGPERADFACFTTNKLVIKADHTKVRMEDQTTEGDYVGEETACSGLIRDSSKVIHEKIAPHDKPFEKILISRSTEYLASKTAAVLSNGNSTAQSEKRIKDCEILHDSTAVMSNMEQVSRMENKSNGTCISSYVNVIEDHSDNHIPERINLEAQACSPARDPVELGSDGPSIVDRAKPTKADRNKRKRELEQTMVGPITCNSFIRSPCEGLRPRNTRFSVNDAETNEIGKKNVEDATKTPRKKPNINTSMPSKENNSSASDRQKKANMITGIHKCEIEGCRMSFKTGAELLMHKHNQCTYDGCGKCFRSHKYTMLHLRVHADERPLKCPWKGCKMSFKWAWARTEHLRVHTGERPYKCKFDGCGLTFRFVSDYSRHRRRTGHYVS